MAINQMSCLNQIASFFKVPCGKIFLNEHCQPVQIIENVTTTGLSSIICRFLSVDSSSRLYPTDRLERAEIRQWLEYASTYLARINTQTNKVAVSEFLNDLNEVLSTRTYLACSTLTIADLLIFYMLWHIIENLHYLEKEKYVHVSRWFDNLQQDASVRQKSKLVDFNVNYLAAHVPARH